MFLYDNQEVSLQKTKAGVYKDIIGETIVNGINKLKDEYTFPITIKWPKHLATPDQIGRAHV